jgi:bifunctional non-homologous end joining protein LigD
MEGIVQADRRDYLGRNRNWIKIKCGLRQEFVIGVFTNFRLARGFGALLSMMGKAIPIWGRTGTGFPNAHL